MMNRSMKGHLLERMLLLFFFSSLKLTNLTRYNYSTDHSLFRAGGSESRYGVGSSNVTLKTKSLKKTNGFFFQGTTTLDMPHVDVNACKEKNIFWGIFSLFWAF